MKKKIISSTLIVLALVVSACASATPSATAMPVSTTAPVIPVTGATDTPAATAMPAATSTPMPMATPTSAAMINVSQNAALGSFLVDANGMTLYVFANDSANTSTCSGACSTNWPPVLTNGAPVAGTGVTASMLGTIQRADGSMQVTYNSLPLYNFAGDKAAGDTKGQGVKNLWSVIDPTGMAIVATPSAAMPAETPTATMPYGG